MTFFKRIITFPVLVLILLGCDTKEEQGSNPADFSQIPDQESWNATLTSTTDGVISHRIKYVQMQKFSNRRLTKFLQGVEIELFDEDGSFTADLKAQCAALDEVTRIIKFTGNVEITSESGFHLQTEKLSWDQAKDRITSEEYVAVVTAEGDTIHGVGFECRRDLESWSIKKPWGVSTRSLSESPGEQ